MGSAGGAGKINPQSMNVHPLGFVDQLSCFPKSALQGFSLVLAKALLFQKLGRTL